MVKLHLKKWPMRGDKLASHIPNSRINLDFECNPEILKLVLMPTTVEEVEKLLLKIRDSNNW